MPRWNKRVQGELLPQSTATCTACVPPIPNNQCNAQARRLEGYAYHQHPLLPPIGLPPGALVGDYGPVFAVATSLSPPELDELDADEVEWKLANTSGGIDGQPDDGELDSMFDNASLAESDGWCREVLCNKRKRATAVSLP